METKTIKYIYGEEKKEITLNLPEKADLRDVYHAALAVVKSHEESWNIAAAFLAGHVTPA